MIFKCLKKLRADFWGTLARWQNHRPIWLAGGGIALFLEFFSVGFFQTYLRLDPCELCVYIRFSMVVIFIGALIAAINPKNKYLKIIGYFIIIWGIIKGVLWDVALELENLKNMAEDTLSICSPDEAKFPFGLPLAEWLPSHFMPLALCGEDSNWTFLWFNMAEWLFFVYAAFAIGITLMLVSWIKSYFTVKQQLGR